MQDNLITIGIDVSKDFLDGCILPARQTFRVPNTNAGFAKIVKIIHEKPVFRIILEHTGGHQKPAVEYLQNKKYPVSVASPAQVR
jgi:transposase